MNSCVPLLFVRLEHSIVGRLQDTGADVTLTSWAPDKRYNSKTQDYTTVVA